MYKNMVCGLFAFIALSTNAQTTINIKGKITNKNGAAISNAIVTLVRQNIKDTTGTDGMYTITGSVVSVVEPIVPVMQGLTLDNGILELNLSNPSTVKIDIFNVQGNLLRKEVLNNASSGVYHLNIAEITRTSNVLIVHTTIGDRVTTFRYLPLNHGKYILSEMSESTYSSRLTKAASIMDSLKVTASGFTTKSVAISSYNIEQDISLDSSTSNGKNAPVPSAGCGKSLGSIKSGTYNITSNNTKRAYIIDIPANYDPNKPYRLIFCFHWIGAQDDDVANGVIPNGGADKWGYYGLKRVAKDNNEQCIFIAPQALPGNPGGTWNTSANTDIVFVQDMLKYFKDNFCVDTTRVFATGFSYGGMMTVSVSFSLTNQFRAVCAIAGVGYRIYMPQTLNNSPLPYMHVVGLKDLTCPYTGGETRNGKWCITTHAQNNKCTIPATIPIIGTGDNTHLCYEFKDCLTGYPAKLCTHNYDHIAGPVDNAPQDGFKTWVPNETWKFFSQF